MRVYGPAVYEDSKKFDGHRFYNLSQQSGGATKYQFVSTSNGHIVFGHGKHVCPGRLFASNEVKIILVHLLTKYDLKFPYGKTDRPKAMEMGADLLPYLRDIPTLQLYLVWKGLSIGILSRILC